MIHTTHDQPHPDDRGRLAETPDEISALGWRDIAIRIKREFKDDHVVLTSAGVAFFWFIALVPLLAAGVSLYGLIADPSSVGSVVADIGPTVPEEVSDLLQDQLLAISQSSEAALGVGFVLGLLIALWAASSGMIHLMEALNIAYDEEEKRSFLKKRLMALLLTVGFLAAGLLAAFAFGFGSDDGTAVDLALRVGGWVALLVLMLVAIAALYRYGASREEPKWSWIAPGTLVSLVAWVGVSAGFNFYVSRFGSYNETYGSLGAIVVTLLWMFLTAAVLIMGAEINAEMEHQTAVDTTTGPEKPMGQRGATKADTLGRIPE